MKKVYTMDEVLHKYNKLPATKQVPILFEALEWMQQYSGRSRPECVILAMGYERSVEDDDLYTKVV